MTTLCAKPSSDLDWPKKEDPGGIYYLDFGWNQINPYNPAHLSSRQLAVEEFAKQFPSAKKVLFAISSGQFQNIFEFSEAMEEKAKESPQNYELFCVELFSEYLHRLASLLPEEMTPFVFFDLPKEASFSKLALFLCKRRFEHLQLEFSDQVIPIEGNASTIISLPQDFLYDSEVFEKIFSQIQRPFKCIPEELLNEHWDGVDQVFFHKPTLGDIGQRMLYGFEAAGGEVIEIEQKNGVKPAT